MKKKKVSPLKGRKVNKNRPEDAPKLGRPFDYDVPVKKYVVSLSMPEEVMEEFLASRGMTSKATAIRALIEESLD